MDKREVTASLKLRFEKDSEKTYLAEQYYKLPLQVLPPHYQDDDGTAFLFLLNPSGGIMQGDRLLTEISIGENAGVVLTNTASSKFYKMEDDIAVIENLFYLKENAMLEYIPEHNVPYAYSNVIQNNCFHLKKNSVLFATDAITSGRKAMGEHFEYKRYNGKTIITVENKTVLYDSIDITPQKDKISGLGRLEGNDILAGTYIYRKGRAETIKNVVREGIAVTEKCKIGVTAINDDLAVIKALYREILDYKTITAKIWECCRPVILGKESVRPRKY